MQFAPRWAVPKGGAFRNVRAEDLSAHLMRSLLARNPALEATAIGRHLLGLRATQRWSRVLTSPANAALLAEIPPLRSGGHR
ncbi:3-ketoacyl-CoA thiolase [Citrobacter koseri]|uniref:3-ketoacyl-CoA thiolase n=1 Tax=Citrobacter koseri TaxID=545 RepID=A0A2X2WKB7_CITKO|nr:3-ketoacyl-CoA thiolase [Citrobacter koseri]